LTTSYTLYGTPAPAPNGSATPAPTGTPWVTTIVDAVTQSASAVAGASYDGQANLTDLVTNETDTSKLETTTGTTNAYLALVADATRASGIDVTEVGTTSTESSGVTLQTTFGSGNGIVEELPPVPNAHWENTAARTDIEDDPGGETLTSTYAPDGSYAETIVYPQGSPAATVQTQPNGTGLYATPVVGFPVQSSITVNAPADGLIPIAYEIYGLEFPLVGSFGLPVWYPNVPPVLASDVFLDGGTVATPSSCGAAAAYASAPAVELEETKIRLDTVFGELETLRATSYVSAAYGVVCTVLADDLKNYYDFSVQSDSLGTWSSTPLYETAVTETLGLTAASFAASTSSVRGARPAGATAVRATPSSAGVRAILFRSHLRALHAIEHAFARRAR
jgi:hypothetical protein